jgi:hypothetical protein
VAVAASPVVVVSAGSLVALTPVGRFASPSAAVSVLAPVVWAATCVFSAPDAVTDTSSEADAVAEADPDPDPELELPPDPLSPMQAKLIFFVVSVDWPPYPPTVSAKSHSMLTYGQQIRSPTFTRSPAT